MNYIVVTPEGEETVEAYDVDIEKGCLLFRKQFEGRGSVAGYAKDEWKSYRIKEDT